MHLCVDGQRVIDGPAPRSPHVLGNEQGGHQRLEHAAAPSWDDAHPGVRIGAFEDVHAQVGPMDTDRLGLLPAPVAGVGERPPGPEVLLGGQLAIGDPDVARDPALADDRVVAARRDARVGCDMEGDPVDVRPVVEAEVHAVEQRLCRRRDPGSLVATTWRPVASQPLSTDDRMGIIGSPEGGQAVSFAPVRWSYQL